MKPGPTPYEPVAEWNHLPFYSVKFFHTNHPSHNDDPNLMSDVFRDPNAHPEVNLFTYGYGGEGSLEDLRTYADQLDAMVVDTRISPKSRNPTWRKGNLEDELGSVYQHVKACGNENYKSGGPIKLHDEAVCIQNIARMIENDQPVILLCYCPDPTKCHRSTVCGKVDSYYSNPTRDGDPDDFHGHIHLKPRENPAQPDLGL